MNHKKHIVIIGSGLGGLICGAILSRNGYRITILEQHHTPGGCLQSFVRKGVKFDTGMHYIGNMGENGELRKFWRYMNVLDKVNFEALNPDGFDIIDINGKEYKYASSDKNFVNTLVKQFPNERKEIELYLQKIKEITSHSIFFGNSASPENLIDNDDLKISVNQFLDEITDNKELKNALIGNNLLFTGEKNKTPIYINALITHSYIEGAYRIVGGSDQLATALCEQIIASGGEVLCRSKVVKIEVEEKKATSVILSDGSEIKADYLISNIHPSKTLEMIDKDALRKKYRERIMAAENTTSVFGLYIIFKKDSVPYQNYNYYNYKNQDVWQSMNDEFGNNYLYMHQCDLKNQKYAQSAMVMTAMKFSDVAEWAHIKNRSKTEKYQAFKANCAEILLSRLEEKFPNIKKQIECFYTSTPLTYLDYTGTPDGTVYGTALDISKPLGGLIAHWTKLSNLLFVGQNIYGHGMLGVVISAIIVCGEFLGTEKIINDINKL
ncbi:MAG: phytoene desaturase family protein [Bacteroidales bacterium]